MSANGGAGGEEGNEENVEQQAPQADCNTTSDDIALPRLGYRHVFAALGFVGFFLVSFLRVFMTDAVDEMERQLSWRHSQEPEMVLASFFFGYIVLQMPGGLLAEKYGGKWVCCLGIALVCVFAMLTPLAAHFSFELLIFVRILAGLAEGMIFPSMHTMLSRWAPKEERTTIGALVYCGAGMGSILTLPVTKRMYNDWESVFYMSGLIGLCWCLLLAIFASNTPSSSRFMGKREKEGIARSLSGQRLPVPYKAIWTCPAFFAILIAHISKAYGEYTVSTELRMYLREAYHHSLKWNDFVALICCFLTLITFVGTGILADKLKRRKSCSTTCVRKTFNSLGFVVAALAIGYVGFTDNKAATIGSGVILHSLALDGLMIAGFTVNHIDIAPNFAGTLLGFTNTAAGLCRIAAPYIADPIRKTRDYRLNGYHYGEDEWRKLFLVCSFVSLVGAAAFLLMASGEEQPFNKRQEEEQENLIPMGEGDKENNDAEQEQATESEPVNA